jgi:hypothetical protein
VPAHVQGEGCVLSFCSRQLNLLFLKGVELFGKPLSIRPANAQFQTIQMQQGDQFARDFTNERRSRYPQVSAATMRVWQGGSLCSLWRNAQGVASPNYRQVSVLFVALAAIDLFALVVC